MPQYAIIPIEKAPQLPTTEGFSVVLFKYIGPENQVKMTTNGRRIPNVVEFESEGETFNTSQITVIEKLGGTVFQTPKDYLTYIRSLR